MQRKHAHTGTGSNKFKANTLSLWFGARFASDFTIACVFSSLFFVPHKKISVALLRNFVAWVCARRSHSHAHNNFVFELLRISPLPAYSHHILYFVPHKKISVALLWNFVAWVCARRSASHAHNNFVLELLRNSPLAAYSHHILYFVPHKKISVALL